MATKRSSAPAAATATKKQRKDKPLLVVTIPEALDVEIEEATRRLSTTKTSLVHRALSLFFRLENETLVGAKIQIIQASGERETFLFP